MMLLLRRSPGPPMGGSREAAGTRRPPERKPQVRWQAGCRMVAGAACGPKSIPGQEGTDSAIRLSVDEMSGVPDRFNLSFNPAIFTQINLISLQLYAWQPA